MHYHVLSI